MSIIYKHSKDIDYRKWDLCIHKSFNGIVYAYSWYLDIVSEEWGALIEGDYKNVMPLPYNKKYGISYLYQPYFTQQLGVFSTEKLGENTVAKFLKSIPKYFKYIDINLNIFNKILSDDFYIIKKKTFQLDLIRPYGELKTLYSKNTKRNINKALSKKITISKALQVPLLINLFKNNKGTELPEIKEAHYKNIRDVINFSLQHKMGYVYGAYSDKNELLASAFFIISNKKVIFLFAASTTYGKKNSAMFLIIDEFIKLHSEKQLTLDFEGSNIDGLARFYSSFGAKQSIYSNIKRNNLPWFLKLFKK